MRTPRRYFAHVPIGDIDAPYVVGFRAKLIKAGVGPSASSATPWSCAERASTPFKAVKKPAVEAQGEVIPLTPLQVERVAADIAARGYRASAVLVRLLVYAGLRPQEALALRWFEVRDHTLLVEFANANGKLVRLKNRKRAKRRSRTVGLFKALKQDLTLFLAAAHGQTET